MKRIALIGLFTGLLIFIGLLVWQGVTDVFSLVLSSGWALLWLPIVWLPCFLPLAQSWRLCFLPGRLPTMPQSLMGIWLGRSVNSLLPVATIGGEIVKARLVTLWGSNVNDATASVMVDKTLQAFTVVIWGLIGVSLLIYTAAGQDLAIFALIGFAILALSVTGMVYIQKKGLFSFMARLGGSLFKSGSWEGLSQNARIVDEVIRSIYADKKRIYAASAIKTAGYVLQTTEVWLAFYLLGSPISITEALLLKSLTATISDIAFVIPNGYGIQEGAFIMIGAVLGVNADLALAVSLAIRIREITVDPAGLFIWHQIETRELIRNGQAG